MMDGKELDFVMLLFKAEIQKELDLIKRCESLKIGYKSLVVEGQEAILVQIELPDTESKLRKLIGGDSALLNSFLYNVPEDVVKKVLGSENENETK